MRHAKHKNQLGRKKEHRVATMANLASALFLNTRIRTTLAKAKALRPFAEKVITLACKAEASDIPAQKLHYIRQAISLIRNKDAVKILFKNKVSEFTNRPGGYTRIYKLGRRVSTDAAEMALIEMIPASDEGYKKRKKVQKSVPAPSEPVETSA